jgi:hypothetical protein
MYIWRLPYLSFAVLVATAVVACVLATLLWLRGRMQNAAARGIVSSGAVVAVLAVPFLVDILARDSLAAAARHGMYIDPPQFIFWVPALFAVCLIALATFLFPARGTPGSTFRYRASFVALLLLFALLNCMNFCSPGWCERFGFPFPYSWWSDAILIMEGRNMSAGFSMIAILLDVAAAVGGAYALSLAYRQGLSRQFSVRRL